MRLQGQASVTFSFNIYLSIHDSAGVYHLFLRSISRLLICILIHFIHFIVQLFLLDSMFRVQTMP
jgi:hypothetical protein